MSMWFCTVVSRFDGRRGLESVAFLSCDTSFGLEILIVGQFHSDVISSPFPCPLGRVEWENNLTIYTWKPLDLHKSKQGNTINLNISFSTEKGAAQVGFEPTTYLHSTYEAAALPTELPRQLSWLGRIKEEQGKGNQSNLT